MVAVKEAYNISVKFSFLQTSREKLVIERGKELGNIKCYNASMALSGPLCTNEVSKVYSCISSGSLSDAS